PVPTLLCTLVRPRAIAISHARMLIFDVGTSQRSGPTASAARRRVIRAHVRGFLISARPEFMGLHLGFHRPSERRTCCESGRCDSGASGTGTERQQTATNLVRNG